jgi:hypothetical protein
MLALAWVFAFAFIAARSAHAGYIDPNTGGMLFQVLAVAFGLFSTIIFIFSSRIKMLFYRLRRSMKGEEPLETSVEEKQEINGDE